MLFILPILLLSLYPVKFPVEKKRDLGNLRR